ncbi:MAG: Mu Gam family protein [Pedosphaera sp.]|nr:Mu Gam family protein [Pedosphaera sp.]
MSKRIKQPVLAAKSREEVESLVNEISLATINLVRLTATKDARLLAINESFATQAKVINDAVAVKTLAVQLWAETNPTEFAKRKSIDFPSGVIGFRTGTPAVKTISKWSLEKALEAMRSKFSAWRIFIRVKVVREIDKDAIIAAFTAEKITAEKLAVVGLRVVQDEVFYVQPKVTETETRQVATAEAA